jgi:hypothetical protein
MKTQKKSQKRKIVTIILVLALCAAAGTFFYKQHQKNEAIAKERAQYAQAEQDLDTLSAQIIAKFGQPDDQKKVRKCGYTSSDYGTGALFCKVNDYLLFPSTDVDSTKNMANQMTELGGIFSGLMADETLPGIASSSFGLESLGCLTDVSYHTSSENLKLLGFADLHLKTSQQGTLIELSCSARHPRAVYYPILDS